MADAIKCNLDICLYDSAMAVVENKGNIVGEGEAIFQKPLKSTTVVEKARKTVESSKTTLINRFVGSWNVIPNPPEEFSTRTDVIYIKLVDYITSFITLVLYNSAKGDAWDRCYISILAKTSAKLKLVRQQPTSFAERSLETERNSKMYSELTRTSRHGSKSSNGVFSNSRIPQRYFKNQMVAREHVSELLRHMADALMPKHSNFLSRAFESNTVVLSGEQRTQLVLCSDRKDRISFC